jgi:diguanylate cyclase (GGDEF)-like protein
LNRKPYPGPPIARHFKMEAVDESERSLFSDLLRRIDHLSAIAKYALAALLIAMIGALDVVTGPEIASSILYFLPVALLAWHTHWPATRVAVLACGITWFVADQISGAVYSVPVIQWWNAAVHTASFLLVGWLLSELRSAAREEHRLARTDTLTGVANSRMFIEFATLECARQHRYFHPLSLAFLDCDNFKRVNDLYGHAAGDELLRKIALTITRSLREVDIVARLGGDEFAILLPESDQKAASTVLRKLRNGLKTVGEQYNVTFSIGLVTYLRGADSVDQMLNAADKAMYEAKRAGKNTARHKVFGYNDYNGEQGVLPGI